MLLFLTIIIAVLIFSYLAFVNFYPSFGGDVSQDRKVLYQSSTQYSDGKFVNTKIGVPADASFSEMLNIARKMLFQNVENGRPQNDLKVQKIDSVDIASYSGGARLVWFGHSAFLLQMDGKNILIDPMFSNVPAPHHWFGTSRFNKELPIAIKKLPKIDAVLISHDHYDHLDYGTIKQLKSKVESYIVPLGVGVHLEAWGIASAKITELDWWQEVIFKGIKLACTPAQHFSGRKFTNSQSTLWSSWIITSKSTNLYFSGDGGYGSHFKEIGEKYGPFDLALLEYGQYNKMWPDIHMFPEETAQAGVDVQAEAIMPIHWGAFKLALHSWTDPIERVIEKSEELNIPVIVPEIGAPIQIGSPKKSNTSWWLF